MTQTERIYDTIIVGAGIVGLVTAAYLARAGFKIALIEKKQPHFEGKEHWPLRVSALNHASCRQLNALGVWDEIKTLGARPFTDVEVWEANSNHRITFLAGEIAAPDLGCIVPNRSIIKTLWQWLEHQTNVSLYCPYEVQQVTPNASSIKINLTDQPTFVAPLLIAADGPHSPLRTHLGFGLTQYAYHQHALVTTVSTEKPHRNTAYQVFQSKGEILALLPLNTDRHCSVVWSVSPERADRLKALPREAFNQEISLAFEHRLGHLECESERETYPLIMRHAKHYVQSRVVLVGDAAHTIHPLAGQGVNQGLRDVACLVEILTHVKAKGRDIGELSVLERYQRARKGDNWFMIGAIQGIKVLFSNQWPGLRSIRGAGLGIVGKRLWLKRLFLSKAVG